MTIRSASRTRWAALLGGAVLLASLSGCSAVPHELQGSWRLTSLTDGEGTASSTGATITLELTGDALSGDDSCGMYSGTVLSTDPWRARNVAVTANGCLSGDNPLRGRFTAVLDATTTATRDGADLVLDAPGSRELRFSRVTSRP
jgi:hypothetical protein